MTALLLYSPVGHAHLAAARAVGEGLGPAWACEEIDYLAFMPLWERTLWTGLYHASLRHAPWLWRTWRALTDRPGEPALLRERVRDTGAAAFAEIVRDRRPRIVASTIGAAASLAGAARARTGARFVNALVVTHFRAHRHWARRDADVVFVATDEARDDLVLHGIDRARVIVTGTPLRASLRRFDLAERAEARASRGLGEDPVLVVSSGGTGKYRAHDELLAILEELGRSMDVLVFRGPAGGVEQRGSLRVHHLGFRDDFPAYLALADACVGKLGSLTAAEACAVGTPIVVWQPIPGPEERNAEYLVRAGAARWPRDRWELRRTLTRVLAGEGAALAAAGARLHRPDAARAIATELATRANELDEEAHAC